MAAPFTRAVASYSAETVWPSVGRAPPRFRRTDEIAKEKLGRWPLSVSSDLIAVPAMRAVRLLADAATGESIDRSGGGRFVEVYPAAALHVWGFPSRGYKRAKGAALRARLVSDLAERTADWLTLREEGPGSVHGLGRPTRCADRGSRRPSGRAQPLRTDTPRR
ncbi:DUF429 domain-containing protein [Candidatus Palauibacter sp.]|uniref:DUF429 domain-containing protein n=1 Tax=Candidatus Palauibacter sp. TaxID=3101350 RepID=UPI003AF2F344